MNSKYFMIGWMVLLNLYCNAQSDNQITLLLTRTIEAFLTSQEQLVIGSQSMLEVSGGLLFYFENIPSDFSFSRTELKKYNIVLVDSRDIRNYRLKNGTKIIRILPIKLVNDLITISIASSSVIKTGKKINISSGDYCVYTYRYSCIKQKWELLSVEHDGI